MELLTEKEKVTEFVSWCIEEYAASHKKSGSETAELFEQVGVLDYLFEFADVLKKKKKDYILKDIDEFIAKRQFHV